MTPVFRLLSCSTALAGAAFFHASCATPPPRAALRGAEATTGASTSVTFHPGAYRGRFEVAVHGTGAWTALKPNTDGDPLDVPVEPDTTYDVDIGGRLGRTSFAFTTDAAGEITSLTITVAAEIDADRRGLTFHTVPVRITAPAVFWELGGTINPPARLSAPLERDTTFDLVPGVMHQIGAGSLAGPETPGNGFTFLVYADGTVQSGWGAAAGGKNELRLNAGVMQLKDFDPSATVTIGSNPRQFRNGDLVPVIFGLQTTLKHQWDTETFVPLVGADSKFKLAAGRRFALVTPTAKSGAPDHLTPPAER